MRSRKWREAAASGMLGFMSDLRIQWAHVPFLIGAVVIHVFASRRLFPDRWMGVVLAAAALGAALAVIAVAVTEPRRRHRLVFAPPLAYPLLAGALNSVWPLAMMLPAFILIVRWRAVRIQTGHESPSANGRTAT